MEPKEVLEVGVGDGVIASYLKNNTDVRYTSVDIADDVGADINGSITALPCADKSYDVVCAFEVLEHIPFEQVPQAVAELARVARKGVLVSVPHFGPSIRFSCKIPFLPDIRFACKVPVPLKHTFTGQHYWELGKRGYPARRFRKVLEQHFVVQKEFVPFDNQYHHFFVLTHRT